MYPVSDSYIAARRASVKEERITGGIKLKDGTIIAVDDSVIIQGSLSVSREVCSSGKWDIGTLNYSKMQLRIRDDGAYDHEFGGALIKLSYGIVTAVAEDGTKTWEEVPLPPYYVDGNQTTRKRDMVKLTAYDPIKLLDINYPDTIPTTSLYAALVYVCNRAGIGLALTEDEFNALPNADVIPDFTSESVKTCRDVAMWIAQTVNCCGFCDYRGLLKLKQYKYEGGNNYDRLFTASERSTIEYSDTRTYLAYIQSYSGKDVKLYSKVTSWTGTDAPHIKEGAADLPKNPILQSLTPEQQNAVNMNYLNSRGYPTRYIKATAFVDPALEPLDVAAFSGGNIDVGQIINSVTQIKWKYRGKGTIVCESVSEHSEAASATSTLSLDNALDTASGGDTDEIVRLAPKSQLEKRIDGLEEQVKSCQYISAKVANAQAVDYDSIERGVLSVDFTVDGTDSDVVFSANQLCDVGSAGTLSCIYKVDGATQDFKPVQTLSAGRHVLPHIYAMPLDKGKHNFAVYILSEDGGRGTTDIGWLTGALSGQISGLKNNAPPNENLILYLSGVPEGTEVTLPAYMYANKSAKKYVDWGDGSAVEESTDYAAVSHTYAAGDYVVTIKSGNVSFGGSSMTTGTNFAEYLTRVYFPDGAADISWGNASKNFAALEAVTFGTSAASISWNFLNSTLITSVILPDTVTKLVLTNINKTAITALVIPEKVTSSLSLGACASLKTLEAYGSGSVGARESTNLQKLTIGKNMDTIGTNGYDGCTGLSEIVFLTPSKLTKINAAAFRNCAFADLDLPSTVETIGESAFYGCSGLTSIVLPEKLTTLGKNAFNGCTGLTSVRVGSALTDIYYGAFSGCINLGSINFPDGLLTIGELAFYNTGAISPEFPSSLVTISTKAFQKSGITSAVLRANMTVGTYAFSESGLSELTIENGFAAISDYCFKDTASLESVSVPSSVTKIGAFAFSGSGLKTLHLSEGLETIGASAFRGSQVTSATLPDSVTDVGDHAFTDCESMTGVTIKGNTTLGTHAFSSCGSLASADMGATANIPGYCFNGCKNLNSVSFAADTVVGGSAFAGCGFTSLSLAPFLMTSTLTDVGGMYSLGSGAFANCSNLASVDGLKYKWDVGLKTRTSYIDGDGNKQWNEWEDKGCVEQGIYDSMGATTDSVFNGTKLYNYTEYLKNNGLVNTDDIQYSVYHYTGRNPAYAT